jgi:hypothetical protein
VVAEWRRSQPGVCSDAPSRVRHVLPCAGRTTGFENAFLGFRMTSWKGGDRPRVSYLVGQPTPKQKASLLRGRGGAAPLTSWPGPLPDGRAPSSARISGRNIVRCKARHLGM